MKTKLYFISILVLMATVAGFAQVKVTGKAKAPSLMIGLDSTLIKMEYARWNNENPGEFWKRYSYDSRIVYYCEKAGNVQKSNVAHIYDFDEDGVNVKYTTIAAQEKFKYACEYLNTIALRNKFLYEFQGINEQDQGVWHLSKTLPKYSICNCDNLKVTVTGNLKDQSLSKFVENCPVTPGKSGELLAIEYAPMK